MSPADEVSREEIDRLVAQLANYAARSRARMKLVIVGRPAVPALVAALKSPLEGVSWSAAKTLGDIGAEEAVEALTEALSSPAAGDAAAEALRKITGKEPASEAAPGAAATRPQESVSVARLSDEQLARAIASATIAAEKTPTGYSCRVSLPEGRGQKVEMMLSLKDADGSPLVAFYTECGPAAPDRFEWALKMNLKIPFGSIALRETPEGPKFVMADAYLREGTTVHQLRRAIEVLAKRADAIEQSLTGRDEA